MNQPRDALAFLATLVHLHVEGASQAFREELAKTNDVGFTETLRSTVAKSRKLSRPVSEWWTHGKPTDFQEINVKMVKEYLQSFKAESYLSIAGTLQFLGGVKRKGKWTLPQRIVLADMVTLLRQVRKLYRAWFQAQVSMLRRAERLKRKDTWKAIEVEKKPGRRFRATVWRHRWEETLTTTEDYAERIAQYLKKLGYSSANQQAYLAANLQVTQLIKRVIGNAPKDFLSALRNSREASPTLESEFNRLSPKVFPTEPIHLLKWISRAFQARRAELLATLDDSPESVRFRELATQAAALVNERSDLRLALDKLPPVRAETLANAKTALQNVLQAPKLVTRKLSKAQLPMRPATVPKPGVKVPKPAAKAVLTPVKERGLWERFNGDSSDEEE